MNSNVLYAKTKCLYHTHIAKECKKCGVHFFTSAYSFDLVDKVERFVPAYKVGSGDITWSQLLEHISQKNKPVILATGASKVEDVIRAHDLIRKNNDDLILLQCNTNYENIKSLKCYLDFDDQILLVKMLLSQSSMAQWVMYKLDGGIEHILIDEAQDTSPDQWDVIKLLTDEFNTGEAKKNKPRTIFAVGDEKQSIYSFQGADPFAFEQMRRYFSDKLIEANDKLSEQRLLYSFRSSPIILKLVDKVLKEGGSSLNLSDQHIAFKDELPGRVDLWPFIDAERNEEPSLWFEPIDSKKPNNPNLKLAEKIAAEIKYILDSKQILGSPNDCRIVQPGDFLILLRSRNFLFHSIIKCLKISGLPVAGADRLNIATELAVKDLLSLLNFLVTPDDDLNLATLLKSPLCGLSENELFHLAKGREGSLWKSLLKNANQHKNILKVLMISQT